VEVELHSALASALLKKGRFHVQSIFLWGKISRFLKYGAIWGPQPVWTLRGIKKYLAFTGNRTIQQIISSP